MLALSKHLTVAALAVGVAAVGWGSWQQIRAERAEAAASAAQDRAAAAERATDALSAHMRRIEADAARATTIRTQIEDADHATDCPVPDWLTDALRGLRTGTTGSGPR